MPVYKNMRQLCYTDVYDFTDIQGIGGDPIYMRFDSVSGVVKNYIDIKYRSFLARPYYDDDKIYWYVDEGNEEPVCMKELTGEERSRYEQIKNDTISHYKETLSRLKADNFAILSAALKFVDSASDDSLFCYDGKVVMIAWGMRLDPNKFSGTGTWKKGLKVHNRCTITFDTGNNGRLKQKLEHCIHREKGTSLNARDIPDVIPNDEYEFAGWSPEPKGYEVTTDVTFIAQYNKVKVVEAPRPESGSVRISFDGGNNGVISGGNGGEYPKGHVVNESEKPSVAANRGWRFVNWSPDISKPVNRDTTFTAQYERDTVHCFFDAGEHGTLKGKADCDVLRGASLMSSMIPVVVPHKGYKFTGWNISPQGIINGDTVFTAQYEKKLPWYKRFWLWLTGSGCLKWLLWLLLLALILAILSYFLRACGGCSSCTHKGTDIYGNPVYDNDTVVYVDIVIGHDGRIRDHNGEIRDIRRDDGRLPDGNVVAPIIDDDGELPPVIPGDGTPDIVANRLLIFFEDENADLNKWSQEFKNIYPDDQYAVIGADKNVPMIQIMIPENERNNVKKNLTDRITDPQFFIVDEAILQIRGEESAVNDASLRGWHLQATHVKEAWNITRGEPNIIVAIVDDGIEINHPIFSGRFYKAYNVFTQNRTLSAGSGHGTHVAGLAAGSAQYYDSGASGVAPNCKIMPVQVFDNGVCALSSIASGIMYAVHNGANVVNISIGPSFPQMTSLTLEEQKKIAEQYYKNEERVYNHIFKVAKDKNVILVFAAGNDDIMTAVLPECRSAESTVNVAAVTPELKASKFTNYSLGTSISAPGVSIYSSFPRQSFKMMDGTSMAAPIVTGAIALMKSIKPDITVGQVIGVMQKSGQATDNSIPPMVLIDKALECVKSGDIPDGPVIKSPYGGKDETADPDDDNAALRQMLDEFIKQRDVIDRKINEINNKLKNK